MTRRIRTIPFQTKLLLALLAVSVTPTLVVCLVLSNIHFVRTRQMAREDLMSQMRVIAIHSQAALSFDDASAGRETLAALSAQPSVRWAAVYNNDGDLCAVYAPRGDVPPDTHHAGEQVAPRGLLLRQAIQHDDQRLGTILASYSLDTLYRQLGRDIALSILAGLAAAAAAVACSFILRRYLVQPLRELVQTAQSISQTGDYTARAGKLTQDEFGDLTDTFNAMLDRIQAQDAELQHRNDEMQQVLYTVSHDLKSPLVTISGFVGLMMEDVAQKQYDALTTSMDHLARASQHMGQLIDDLLELSRIGRVRNQLEQVDTNVLVRELASDLAPQMEKCGCSEIQIGDLPTVMADRMRLTQVFSNLITNALKYGITAQSTTIEIGARRRDREIQFFVRDHGPGIAPEYRQRVFVLFQRLQKSGDGTGVGLTIVTKIVETHGGRVWFEETPGGGATFWFALPETSATNPQTPTKLQSPKGTSP